MRNFYTVPNTKPADVGDALCVIFLSSLPLAFFKCGQRRENLPFEAAGFAVGRLRCAHGERMKEQRDLGGGD